MSGQPYAEPAAAAPVLEATGESKIDEKHLEHDVNALSVDKNDIIVDGSRSAGLAVIEQIQVIPKTGKRIPTSRWEYITFCLYYFANNGAPIGGNGGALRQALLSQANPSGIVHWGGQVLTLNALLLDISGILFAVQAFILLFIGPFADYGRWRGYILTVAQVILWIMQFSLVGIHKPSQWQIANGIYIVGSLAANISVAFYQATFPALVRDLPKIIQSENEVRQGLKSPEEHERLDQYERAQLYNMSNITGSALVVVTYAISIGISYALGYGSDATLIHSYNILLAYFGAITVLCTLPFLILQKHRPGQALPEGVSFWTAGPRQVWSATKHARHLKHCMLYLVAWCCLQESWGTWYTIVGILQNEVIDYSPLKLNALSMVADLGGGSGTVMMYLLQKRYRFSIQTALRYGAIMTVLPCLYGGIGMFTHAFGFHHSWEFWIASSWNFMTGCWGAYSVSMISEVVPAPKLMLFFAMFNIWGKTSGFLGPFITSAIIERAHGNTNAAFWFLFALGTIGVTVLWQVNTDQAKLDNAAYLEREAQEMYSQEQRRQGAEFIATGDEEFAAQHKAQP
ncbi:putative autophagy protein [Kockovaella imperatae]|uniref:Autophagy-related protein n=1 Tax=Kockovaella imperatae TaxID=4999 RepID=A0A1Y1UIM5_9TREE|nr:putative autophagy protein [Kockovaella imperatae]ORX36955.1 putative autophagy protein [Kockovaella imperatae]